MRRAMLNRAGCSTRLQRERSSDDPDLSEDRSTECPTEIALIERSVEAAPDLGHVVRELADLTTMRAIAAE